MNSNRRNRIKEVMCLLEKILYTVEELDNEERESLVNLPDALQSRDREMVARALSESYDNIGHAVNNLGIAIEQPMKISKRDK